MTIDIGRLSGLPGPSDFRRGRTISLRGYVQGASLAELRALRDELVETSKYSGPIAVAWTEDPTFDGFYLPAGGSANLVFQTATAGLVEWTLNLVPLQSERFQSMLTGKIRDNDHTYADASKSFVGPPRTAYGFRPIATRVGRNFDGSGNISIYQGVASTDHPTWSVAPADFYTGAVALTVDSYVRVGLRVPNSPTGTVLSNGLVRADVQADGTIDFEYYDGSAWQTHTLTIYEDAAQAGAWDSLAVVRNDPERVGIRLVQTRGTYQGSLQLDLGLRRGSRTIEGVYTSDDAASVLQVRTDETGTTTGAPTGSMKRSSNDTEGNRWLLGSELTVSFDTANGAITKTAARLPFMVSEIIGHAAPATGDDDDDLWSQYMEHLTEKVREVRP